MFAREVDRVVGEDGVVFINTGFNTLELFLHRHQAGDATAEQIAQAKWAIMPLQPETEAEVVSQPVPQIQEKRVVLGLYRIEAVRARL